MGVLQDSDVDNKLPKHYPVVKDSKVKRKAGKEAAVQGSRLNPKARALDDSENRGKTATSSEKKSGGGQHGGFKRTKRHCAGVQQESASPGTAGHETEDRAPFQDADENREPTDFRDMFAGVRGARTGTIGSRPPKAAIDREAAMTDFEEIVAKQKGPQPQDAPVAERGVLADIVNLKSWVEAGDAGSRQSFPKAGANGQAKGSSRLGHLLEPTWQPTMDWSLKTSVRFSSSQPFRCCQETLEAPQQHASAVLDNLSCRQPDGSAPLQERWQQAQMSWQHPAWLFEPAVVATLSANKSEDLMLARRRTWQESFRSLYYSLRFGSCAAFYLISPKGAKNPFVALFSAAGVGGHRKVHAQLSRSTRGLRALLNGPSEGLTFSMPLAPDVPTGKAEELHVAELRELGQPHNSDRRDGIDNKPASLLYFSGGEEVHGIYTWLYNSVMLPSAENCDVPTLLAPMAFVGATLRQLQPQILPLAAQAQSKERTFRVEMKGIIPPWTLDRLCALVHETQGGNFQVLAETDPLTSSLNLDAPSGESSRPSATGELQPERRGCLSKEELLRWKKPVGPLSGLVIRALKCTDGLYTAQAVSM